MKVLNLDKLAPRTGRELVLFGETYTVKELSVKDFIRINEHAEKLTEDSELGVQISATIDVIVNQIPGIDRKILEELNPVELKMILDFVKGDDPEDLAKAAKEEGILKEEETEGEEKK